MSRPYSKYSIDALETLASEAPEAVLEELRFRHTNRAKHLRRALRTASGPSETPAKPPPAPGAVPAVYLVAPTRASNETLARLSAAKRSQYLAAYEDMERAIRRLGEVDQRIPAAAQKLEELRRRAKPVTALERLALGSYHLHAMARERGVTLPAPVAVGLDAARFQALVAAADEMGEAQAALSALRSDLKARVKERDTAVARCSEILAPLQSQDNYDATQAGKRALAAHVTKLQSQSSARLEVLWRHREQIDPLRAAAARLVLRRRAGFDG